jgi:hypothetical protein
MENILVNHHIPVPVLATGQSLLVVNKVASSSMTDDQTASLTYFHACEFE